VTTTILLVRHCTHELLDQYLVGRRIDVPLSDIGIERSGRLAARLADHGVSHIKSSPRFRALQTARPLALKLRLPIVIMREFDEIDFGDWAGRTFDELRDDPRWARWNAYRGTAAPPRGESMGELQRRVVHGILSLVQAHPNQCVVIVSHAEPIRAAILHFRRIALKEFALVQVDPGSWTTLEFQDERGAVIRENQSVDGQAVAA
jgi:probable phosphoglycerate mutase